MALQVWRRYRKLGMQFFLCFQNNLLNECAFVFLQIYFNCHCFMKNYNTFCLEGQREVVPCCSNIIGNVDLESMMAMGIGQQCTRKLTFDSSAFLLNDAFFGCS